MDGVSESNNSLFGLTEPQLAPVVERIAGEPVLSFRVDTNRPPVVHYGYSGDKVVATFSYTAQSGAVGEAAVFVKWLGEPGDREGIHYTRLKEHGAPVPELYGSLITPDGREMIFVELLDPVDDQTPFDRFEMDAGRFPQFLRTAARLNAIQPSEEYARELMNRPEPSARDWVGHVEEILGRIWQDSLSNKLGTSLYDLCRAHQDGPEHLRRLAAEQVEPVDGMEYGLVHGDYDPDSTGFRKGTGEMLLVDLEAISFGRRFEDVAASIAAPEDLYPRCLSQRDLADVYLGEYVRSGGPAVPLEAFLGETHALWIYKRFSMLWWWLNRALDGLVDWTENQDEGRRTCRAELHRQLRALLSETGDR